MTDLNYISDNKSKTNGLDKLIQKRSRLRKQNPRALGKNPRALGKNPRAVSQIELGNE